MSYGNNWKAAAAGVVAAAGSGGEGGGAVGVRDALISMH